MYSLDSAATELPWLWAGLAAYALATFVAMRGVMVSRRLSAGAMVARGYERTVLATLVLGVGLLTVCLAERWLRIGHGPFVNLFELIISQLFSLGLIYAIVYWRWPQLRGAAVVVLPALWILGAWVLTLEPEAVPNPPTYFNDWKWLHVGFGKIFLGFCLVGTGLAGVILLRGVARFEGYLRSLPQDEVLDMYAWRFMLLGLVFESLMLIAGAVWAQDAWGRYWAWDALETSAFLNWLALGGAIHARFTYRIPLKVGAMVIIGVFVFAFFTYFGTPFYSEAAHKGVV
jgi:ABC-type transport system involved in cytochrome c biogenesis permease subunit